MIALLQRVLWAKVEIHGEPVAAIGPGLLAFVGVRPGDTEQTAARLMDRLLHYRIFADDAGKMNLNLLQIGGELLLVPQFTLAADTTKGLRPSFSGAAPPDQGRRLFDAAIAAARTLPARVACGVFGADMQVSLTNDGPVTFWLED